MRYAAIFAVGLLGGGCFSPVDIQVADAEAVRVQLVFTAAGRTIHPGGDLQPAVYYVTAHGPDGSSREQTVTDTVVSLELEAGSWVFAVDAFTAEGKLIGQASQQVEIAADTVDPVYLVLQPVEGSGQLSIDMTWQAEAVAQPGVSATLTPAGTEDVEEIQFAVQDGSAEYQSEAIAAGYYLFEAVLSDGEVEVRRTGTQVVWIVAGEVSTASFSWDLSSADAGVQIQLDTTMLEPLPLEIAAHSSEMVQDSPLELTAEMPTAALTADESETAEIWWYVEGAAVQQGSSCILPDTLEPGVHSVSAVLIAGSRAASDMCEVTVLPVTSDPDSGAAILSMQLDPSTLVCGSATTGSITVATVEYGDTRITEMTADVPQHAVVSLEPVAEGSWNGSGSFQFAQAGTYQCEITALDSAGITLDTCAAPLRVRADPLTTRTAFPGADFDGYAPDGSSQGGGESSNLGLPSGAEVSAAAPLVGSGCLHFSGEYSGAAGNTITIPLTSQPFVPLQDSTMLSFWFRGTVSGQEPALRLQVAGGGSVQNYYDLNGIQGDEVSFALGSSYGGVFPTDVIDVASWTRVELDLTQVDWEGNGGQSAEDYVLTIRIRSGSVHDWYIDDIRFE